MGVSCVKGQGEAEATCAQLNADGVCMIFISIYVKLSHLHMLGGHAA